MKFNKHRYSHVINIGNGNLCSNELDRTFTTPSATHASKIIKMKFYPLVAWNADFYSRAHSDRNVFRHYRARIHLYKYDKTYPIKQENQ